MDLKNFFKHNFCLKARSENGYGFLRSGLQTGVENYIFWSEIESGFGEPGGTPPPRIPRSTLLTVTDVLTICAVHLQTQRELITFN